jgi:hypothetical protein
MLDNGITTYYKETTTTLLVKKGWNYIGFHADEIYEYTYVTIYHRSEQHTASPYYSKYETVFKGYYISGMNDDVTVLGCKSYQMFGITSSWPSAVNSYTFGTTTWPTDL